MKTTHSPGPWAAQVSKPTRRDPSGTAMVATGAGSMSADFGQSGRDWAQSAANAKLASAAPELLAALREAIADYDGWNDTDISRKAGMSELMRVRRARAAIRAATGED